MSKKGLTGNVSKGKMIQRLPKSQRDLHQHCILSKYDTVPGLLSLNSHLHVQCPKFGLQNSEISKKHLINSNRLFDLEIYETVEHDATFWTNFERNRKESLQLQNFS